MHWGITKKNTNSIRLVISTEKREAWWTSASPLQKLLQHPELSNSQLLADFLSPNSTESQFLDRMLPDVNLGIVRVYQCDGLCLGRGRTCHARSRVVCAARPWVWVKRWWWWAVGKQCITEIKYLCFTGKIIKSVPSKLIKEVSNALLGCGLLATVQCFISIPKLCVSSVRKGNIWSLSSSRSSTPANPPNPSRVAPSSPSSAPPQKTTKRSGTLAHIHASHTRRHILLCWASHPKLKI